MNPSLRTSILLCAALFSSLPGLADPSEDGRFHLYPEMEKDIGFSQAVRAGDTLYISGCVGSGAMPDAIAQVYNELQTTLKAHGLTFKDVVKENVYATDLDAFIANAKVRKAYYGDRFPAATWLGIKRLYLPEQVVEVDLVAHFPAQVSGQSAK